MLTSMRANNKSVLMRKVFLWSNVVVSLSYLAVLIIGRVTYEYTEVKEMMQDEDKERLRKDEINLERNLSKIIPDIFSLWTLAKAIVVVLSAFFLIEIQKQEEDEAQLVDQACYNTYVDIYYQRP
jgi:heme exporter protein D